MRVIPLGKAPARIFLNKSLQHKLIWFGNMGKLILQCFNTHVHGVDFEDLVFSTIFIKNI
jgi:hypothetical protein